ncbi:hepcidin-like [Dunckerocampus dactyliophorus]|uniref:hepcidin-like n=1 Tax=Dunckerocampus dactyliophorus TaxID=161453 RepID=UPI0024053C9C|nr:hepcidin-like [Dunckerocampus dactyliophorus]
MKTFNFAVAVIITLALFIIREAYTFPFNDDVARDQDWWDARNDMAAEFHELPADPVEMADVNNRQKRHSDPRECRVCCDCCGGEGFCGLCCEWTF